MNEKILNAIAKKYSVSTDDVKRDIQAAIEAAYINPNPEAVKIPLKGAIPTIDEIVEYFLKQSAAH